MRLAFRGLVGLALMACLGASGCGDARSDHVDVSGTVTIDSEPIGSGTITFIAADGATPTGGGVIKDGAYTAQVPPGEKVVLVLGHKIVGQEPLYKDMADSPMRDKMEMITPPGYNAAHLTPLKASITESQEGLNFELSKSFDPK
jgi:hypothetical protein